MSGQNARGATRSSSSRRDDAVRLLGSLVVRGGESSSERLDMLRHRIDMLDSELIDILRRRMETSTEIGEYKREHSMPVVQEGRYRALMEERIAEAAGLGLSEAFMRGLFQAVHAESVRLQLP